jgi:cyclic pyranopterin monophosphate synthase
LAVAEAWVHLPAAAQAALAEGGVGKGDPLVVAHIAGIQAAKRTSDLIPLCHPLPLAKVQLEITNHHDGRVQVVATVRTTAATGVEMEALTAASVAALTIYDMLKAASKGIEITGLRLLRKTGGASGDWQAEP